MYSAPLPVLADEVTNVDPSQTAMTARDFLLYCYYGGMVFIGALLHTYAFVALICVCMHM